MAINKKYLDLEGLEHYESTIKSRLGAEANTRLSTDNNLQAQIDGLASGSPLVASSTSEMTDTTRVYVNTTDGHWYYYNGSSWADGGVYQASALSDGSVGVINLNNTIQQAIGLIALSPVWTTGKYLNSGVYIKQYGYSTSDPIELKAGSTIYFNATGYQTVIDIIDTCDSEGNNRKRVVRSIDSSAREYSYTATENCYVILCSTTNGIGFAFIDENINSRLDNVVDDTIDKLTDVYINKSLIKDNYYLNHRGNEMKHDYGIYAVTDFIEISELSKYSLNVIWNIANIDNLVCYAFYDENRNFISSVSMGGVAQSTYEINSPNNAAYFKSTVPQSKKEQITMQLDADIVSLNDKISKLDLQSAERNTLFSAFNKFGVIGDSLASGESVAVVDGSARYIDNYNYSWGQYIAKKYGMECINFSAGGLTTRNWLTSNVGLSKLQNSDNKCNAYIIGLGVNDKNVLGDNYLGSMSDIKENFLENNDTFYGNYGKIISYIKQTQPKAKIFLLTIPDQTTPSTVDYSNFNIAIRAISNHFDNCYLIDLEGDHNSTYTEGFVRQNLRGGHYNAIAYDYLADKMYQWISDYMKDNYSEFSQIEFIGTDYKY